MSNDARFEFVLIDGGSQSGTAPSQPPQDRESLEQLVTRILGKQGIEMPKGTERTATPTPTISREPTTPRPAASSSEVIPAPAVPNQLPTVPTLTEPRPVPAPTPIPQPREPEPMQVPRHTDVTGRTPEPIVRPEPLTPPKPEPLPEFKPLSLPEPIKPSPLPPREKLEPLDRQPTEPSKVPERFVNYPPKETPTPITPSDLEAMKKDYGKPYDPIKPAEDLARQESADRMRSLAERMNAEREQRLAEAAAKRKADHERAMAASDEAIKARYNAPDAKKIFEELRADAKKAADLKYGPSPIDRTTDIIDAIVVDGKDAAKATATAAAGKLAAVMGPEAAKAAGVATMGGVAGGAAAGGALAGIAATAATGTLAGMAAAAPAMAYRSVEQFAEKLIENLGDLSPEVAIAQARADAAMTFRRIEMARQFGPDLAKIVEGDSDMRVAGSRIGGAVMGPIVEDFADFKKGLGDVAEALGKFADNNKEFIGDAVRAAIESNPWTGIIGDAGRLMTWMTGGGDQQQQSTLGAFLEELDFITPPGWETTPELNTDAAGGLMFR